MLSFIISSVSRIAEVQLMSGSACPSFRNLCDGDVNMRSPFENTYYFELQDTAGICEEEACMAEGCGLGALVLDRLT